MAKRLLATLFGMICTLNSLSAATFPYKPNPTDVRIVPVERTPESNTVKLKIVFPERSELKRKEPVRLQFQVSGFGLRTNSDFPRINEIWNDPEGQSIHVIIDNRHFFSLNNANIRDIDSRESFRTQIIEVDVPFYLSTGEHIVRAFPVRSYNESLKNRGTFAVDTFYFRSKENTINQNLKGPFLTYNEPTGTFDYSEEGPILLDFLLANTELSTDGYKVEFSIDGKVQRLLTSWVPYYIYGLKRGTHVIRLRLLDPQNKLVPGEFNDYRETIVIR